MEMLFCTACEIKNKHGANLDPFYRADLIICPNCHPANIPNIDDLFKELSLCSSLEKKKNSNTKNSQST